MWAARVLLKSRDQSNQSYPNQNDTDMRGTEIDQQRDFAKVIVVENVILLGRDGRPCGWSVSRDGG